MIPPANVPDAITERDDNPKCMTVFLWGHAGTHKTSWSAQWPAPLFFSIASEGGDDALRTYPEIAASLMQASQLKECPPVFNTAQPPRYHIKHTDEVGPLVMNLCQNHKKWGVCTVVIDSLTYLVDLWISDLLDSRMKQSGGKIPGGELVRQQDWGFLNNFLRTIRVHLNNAGLNVIWTCLQQDIYKSNPNNQAEMYLDRSIPMLQGQSRVKLPGACKLHINAVATKVPHPQVPGRMQMRPTYYTTPDSNSDLRHKYAFRFPKGCLIDPEFDTMPTFRAMWAELHDFIYVGR